ncbi:hypothetical protein CGRA01v4_15081 [Colletotrichum graminicola]|nr:hypothetical protein CGRA01v4_15081 [Colletotrichum graminicola]
MTTSNATMKSSFFESCGRGTPTPRRRHLRERERALPSCPWRRAGLLSLFPRQVVGMKPSIATPPI